jgi:transposase
MVAADARTAIAFALSPGNAHDAPKGRELLWELPRMPEDLPLLMDRAYEGDQTRQLVLELGMVPVVPPKCNRRDPWEYDRALYKTATRLNGCSEGSRASAESSRASRNSTYCSLASLTSLSPSKLSDSVNTP